EMLAALTDDFEPAAQGENAVHDATERQRQRRSSRVRQQTAGQLTPHQQPGPTGARRTQGRETVVDELRIEGREVRRENVRKRGALGAGNRGVARRWYPFRPSRARRKPRAHSTAENRGSAER